MTRSSVTLAACFAIAACGAEARRPAVPRADTVLVARTTSAPVDSAASVASSDPIPDGSWKPDSITVATDTMLYAWEEAPQWLLVGIDTSIQWERGRRDSMPDRVECTTFAGHRVITREKDREAGSDVIVRDVKGACTMDSVAGDFVVRNQFAEYFAALRGNLLLLVSSTGPQESFALHDITARHELGWVGGDIVGWRDSTTAIIWERKGSGDHRLCPRVHPGLQVVIDSLYSWDLKTGQRTAMRRMRCNQES